MTSPGKLPEEIERAIDFLLGQIWRSAQRDDKYAEKCVARLRAALEAREHALTADDLVTAWNRYVELFGDRPYGTHRQMAAFIELLPRCCAAEAKMPRSEEFIPEPFAETTPSEISQKSLDSWIAAAFNTTKEATEEMERRLRESLPALRRALGECEAAKKISRALLEREITI